MKSKPKSEPESKKPETKQIKRWLRCNLTNEEKLTAGKLQADKAIEIGQVEDDAKRISAEFKAKLATIQAELSVLANKISSGYEHRNVECTVHFATPKPNKKRIVRNDTQEEVCIEDMTQDEMQRELINEEETEPTTKG